MYLYGTRADAAPFRAARLPQGFSSLPFYGDDDHTAIDDTARARYKRYIKGAAIVMPDPPESIFGNPRLRTPKEPYGVRDLKAAENDNVRSESYLAIESCEVLTDCVRRRAQATYVRSHCRV